MVILHDAKYNSEWGFYAFLKNRTKTCFVSK